MSTRELPHSIEAEEHLLSGILIDGADTLSKAMNAGLIPAMFYSPANRLVFEKLAEILSSGKPVELAVLAQELSASKQLEEIGGYAFLTQISGRIPTTAQVGYFIDKIRDLSVLREFIRESHALIERCHNPNGELTETLAPVSRLLALASGATCESEPSWDQVVSEAGGDLESIIANDGLPPKSVIPFPWVKMNDHFSPMQRGQLVVLAARTSIGKSSLARQITLHAAEHGHWPYYVTLEVNPRRVALQMSAAACLIGLRDVAKSSDGDQNAMREALRKLSGLGVTISSKDRSIARITGRARALHAKGRLDMLVVDHGMLTDDVSTAKTSELRGVIGNLTKALKRLAVDLNIVVLLLWQLNRGSANDDREPSLIDLKESGSLEEDADKVLLIHRPTADGLTGLLQHGNSLPKEQPRFFQNIIQAKGRDDGTALLSFYFNRATASFEPAQHAPF